MELELTDRKKPLFQPCEMNTLYSRDRLLDREISTAAEKKK